MPYASGSAFLADPHPTICLIGFSGVGKTHLARCLRHQPWHVDYHLWTEVLGTQLARFWSDFAAGHPITSIAFLEGGLQVVPRVEIDNLSATLAYMGQPGLPAAGGMFVDDYNEHMVHYIEAERRAMLELMDEMSSGSPVLQVLDTSGSLPHVLNFGGGDPILDWLTQKTLVVYIEASGQETAELLAAAQADPKPLCMPRDFLAKHGPAVSNKFADRALDAIEPVTVMRELLPPLVKYRAEGYRQIVEATGGITLPRSAVWALQGEQDITTAFEDLVALAIDERRRAA